MSYMLDANPDSQLTVSLEALTDAKTPNDQHLDDDFIDNVGTVEVEVKSILGLQSFQTTVRHHSTVFQPAQPPPPPQQQQKQQSIPKPFPRIIVG